MEMSSKLYREHFVYSRYNFICGIAVKDTMPAENIMAASINSQYDMHRFSTFVYGVSSGFLRRLSHGGNDLSSRQ